MRILHLCTYDNLGGVARAAIRLHQGMIDAGYDSHFLCVKKDTDVMNVHVVTKSRFKLDVIDKLIRLYRRLQYKSDIFYTKNYPDRSQYFTSNVETSNFLFDVEKINPDIVHIHWINEMCRIEDIKKIKRPIVWNLHDASVFAGGCHVVNDCVKYQTHCAKCPALNSTIEKDLSYQIFERKLKHWSDIQRMSIISSSNWMASNAKNSAILKSQEILVIPTGLNCDFFSVKNNFSVESALKSDNKVLLFGANGALTDRNKGFDLLVKAINDNIALFLDCEIWVFGNNSEQISLDLKIPVRNLGFLRNEEMPEWYNKADITIVPSYQECFGQVTIESMACETPVVAFGATGLLDTVEHKVTGYLAKPYDTNDLAAGIRWVMDHNHDNILGQNARKRVVSLFEMKKVVEMNIEFYKTKII
jgi:glycosyltransferase involved in cell wall biosynthesis